MSTALATAVAAAVVLAYIGLYGTPAIIAAVRKSSRLGTVVAINLLLGWTVVGWIVAFALALATDHEEPKAQHVALGCAIWLVVPILYEVSNILWLHIPAP